VLAALLSAGSTAQAGYVVTLEQQRSGLVASGIGTIDLVGLPFFGSDSTIPVMDLSIGYINTGPATPSIDDYIGLTGPASFDRGGVIAASSGSGDLVGVYEPGGSLDLPHGYVSGTSLMGSATWDNQTFANLGVTPGTYVWTWEPPAAAAGDDSFTLVIPATAVPEPLRRAVAGATARARHASRRAPSPHPSYRRSPVTTKSTRRPPHWPQTSRSSQSGTVISAP
jgi:hypothetical protein